MRLAAKDAASSHGNLVRERRAIVEDNSVSTESIRKLSRRAIHTLKLVGEYDHARKPELNRAFESIGSDGPIVLDMTSVIQIDSTFLRALTSLHSRFNHREVTRWRTFACRK